MATWVLDDRELTAAVPQSSSARDTESASGTERMGARPAEFSWCNGPATPGWTNRARLTSTTITMTASATTNMDSVMVAT